MDLILINSKDKTKKRCFSVLPDVEVSGKVENNLTKSLSEHQNLEIFYSWDSSILFFIFY